MKKNIIFNNKEKKNSKWQFTLKPVMKYSLLYSLIAILALIAGTCVVTVDSMKRDAASALSGSQARISRRIEETINLLESMASLPEYYDGNLSGIIKAKKLDGLVPYFGYICMCYVDEDINVYFQNSEIASLASREYMQQLFSTGKTQVTDSFAAGTDGMTLNYTVAVPLKDEQDNITGCLFCSIYFDDVEAVLKDEADINDVEITMVGSSAQIMSSTPGLAYGDSITDALQKAEFSGTTADKIQEDLLAGNSGASWNFYNDDWCYMIYGGIENTKWRMLVRTDFFARLAARIPLLLAAAAAVIVLNTCVMMLIRKYIKGQMVAVDELIHSVEELEKKIYHEEHPDNVDFNEIIKMTSSGLSDELTGVVTRSVFLNQISAFLNNADTDKINVLCFIDMDNLKKVNDTYGHAGGDIALKSIGYVLREYEKKYDGCVGRYGGDEFILFLPGIEDEEELNSIMSRFVEQLHINIKLEGIVLGIQCSVGAAVYESGLSLEELIHNADEALYSVKQNDKGNYKIFQR